MKSFETLRMMYNPISGGINEVFHTYQFAIHNGMITGVADMSLESVEEGKTKVNLIVNNAHGSTSSNSILEGMANDYLLALSKILTGANLDEIKRSAEASGTGSTIALIISIIAIGYIIYLFIS